ncbi:hypothetical protein Btru_048605 [Bulinus truncatus]|nr:hypothetical protein Btru_048605 [Bulinus truncatus]
MSTILDGAALSALCFHSWHLNRSRFGFLLGMRVDQTESKISDSQGHLSRTNTSIYVSSFIPWITTESVYHRNGSICVEAMDHLLKQTNQNLLGWYSFRHNSKFKPSLKEFNLHKNLAKEERFVKCPNDFLFFLCTTSCSENMSTYICNYGFMQVIERQFFEVPVIVVNLGDTTRKDYHKIGNGSVTDSLTLKQILLKHRQNYMSSSGEMDQLLKINTLSTSINKGVKYVSAKVYESEHFLNQLIKDVSQLRKMVTCYEIDDLLFALPSQVFDHRCQQIMKDEQKNQQLQLLINDLPSQNNLNILTSTDLLISVDKNIGESLIQT